MAQQVVGWSDDPQKYNKAVILLGDFFEALYQQSDSSYSKKNTINSIDFSGLRYRDAQEDYALDIMEAIKRREILLVQAGVGIGKSFGFLLPIFYTIDTVEKFNKVIISTSSIALQEQLLGDINRISEMLGIGIKAEIAKGINNYACLKRIEKEMYSYGVDPQYRQVLSDLMDEIRRVKSSDKADLEQVSKEVWDKVRLKNRGFCSGCDYSKRCPYYKKQADIEKSNIIVTNHAYLAQNALDQKDLLDGTDMIVFDEAHKLLENIQGVRTEEFDLEEIKAVITSISSLLGHRYKVDSNGISIVSDDNFGFTTRNNNNLFLALNKLFSRVMASASKNFFETNKGTGYEKDYSVTDSNRLGFRNTTTVNQWLDVVLSELSKLFNEIRFYEKHTRIGINTRNVKYLQHIREMFEDMRRGVNSDYVYWADFIAKNKIRILGLPKDNLDVIKNIFSADIPYVLTSGTISNEKDGYSRYFQALGLDKIVGKSIRFGDEQLSPYDYDNNSLLYYNPDIANPNDRENYIRDLASEISELIRITNGKALILFTSKATMNSVYGLLKDEEFPFDLLLQTDNNATEIKQRFSQDTDSCLFATGAFWEGIDVKGKSLSNLIITRLPFDQVDAVTQYEASKYSKQEQFREVYFPNMLIKFQQAVGRLIRSDTDTGIVCCLDSRITNYIPDIAPNIPIKEFVTNKEELYQFADNKILSPDEIQRRHQ